MTSKIKLEALEDLPEKTSCSHKEERKQAHWERKEDEGRSEKMLTTT